MTEVKSTAVDFDPFAGGEISQTIPLTNHQREIWSAVQLGGDDASCAYNETVSLALSGALDVAALEASLHTLAARHESLRTTFSADGSAIIATTAQLPLERVDLRGESDPTAAYTALEQREVSTAFDIQKGPLGKALLAQLGESDFRLLMRVHHIVCDGWSFGVLLSELATLYAAHSKGEPAQLPEPESFSAYASERAAHEQGPEARAALNYWVEQYRDSVPLLELPLDHPRPALRSFVADRVDHELPSALVAAVRAFAKQQNASLLQVLLTSFQTLLARLTNGWDVVVGISAAGQAHSGKLGLVGHAVSYLPIRGRLDPQASFRETLTRAKRTLGDALEQQDVTFGTILQHLSVARDPSRIPLAPVSFNLEAATGRVQLAGLETESRNVPRRFETFELFANLVDRKETIVVELQYNSDLFEHSTLEAWLDSYETLLAGIVAQPDAPLASLPLLGDSARQELLFSFNETERTYERELPIHGFFEQQVDAQPTRTALVFEGQQLRYDELEQRANKLANHLRSQGVGPEQIVGVCVRRSLDMVVAQLGVLKAGAAYLPLDPTYPPERLQHMLQDAGAKVLVSRQDSIVALGDTDKTVVLLDAHAAQTDAASADRPARNVKGDNIAYVIYTSGSTGKPKGVLVEHRNFANFVAGMDDALTLSPAGVWLSATSIGFDISLLELFGALGRGFTVVLHSDESAPEFALAPLLAQHAVTHFQCTPSQATLLASDPDGKAALSGLRELLLGGEALPLDLARELTTLLSAGRLVNMYGPTETTIWSTTHVVSELSHAVPIGRPIANTCLYILDERRVPVPRGAIGELFIGGAGVTRGYHNRPELNAERFVKDPFAMADGARMYKTGDLARYRADGQVEFLGRNDHQVKLRGYRIELGEIEVALRSQPAVRDAVVIAREDRPGDKRLVAYLVCSEAPTVPELKAFLTQAGLPDYMLPQAFVNLPRLPTTPNGKLDRRALPAPQADTALGVGSYVAPAGEVETQIADGWCSVLGLPRVGTEDNFFDLGGHSLLVVKLAQTLSTRTGRPVSVPDVFRFPTVKSLAQHLAGGSSSDTAAAKAAAQRGAERRGAVPRATGRRG